MKYADHPNVHRLRGSISGASGLEAAQKLDPPEEAPPRTPDGAPARSPDEVAARGPGYSQPDPSYHHPRPTTQPSGVLDMLNPETDSAQYHVPVRSNTEPMSQYDDRYEKPADTRSGSHSPDSDDELEHESRRRSRKFSHQGLDHLVSIGSMSGSPSSQRKGAERSVASFTVYCLLTACDLQK
jgi:hypothetical protein